MTIDTVFKGNFWTGAGLPAGGRITTPGKYATGLAVDNGRIVGVSTRDDLADLDGLDPREVVNVKGSVIVPGFHDAHHHTMGTGEQLSSIDLHWPGVSTLDDLCRAVGERARKTPDGQWIHGAYYDQNHLGGHPTAEMLDTVSPDNPVILVHVSNHMIVANTKAFEAAGYPDRNDYPDFEGGRVVRGSDGRPEGLLQEKAGEPIQLAGSKVTKEEAIANLKLASDQAISFGLTSLVEPIVLLGGVFGANSPVMDIYLDAIAQGALQPRMTVMPFYPVLHELELDADGMRTLDLGIRTGFGDDRLRVGPVKILADGSLIGRSAAVNEPYCGEPDNRGVMRVEPDELSDLILSYHRAGWAVATHAIGDRAIDHVLDAYENAQKLFPRNVRHRIEHFAIATDEQVKRCADLGVIPCPQGIFVSQFGDGVLEALGEERAAGTYRMRSFLDAGMVVPGSTDCPSNTPNPLKSIHDLVNRRTSSGKPFGLAERVSVTEAVHSYTYGSAYSISQEDVLGTLEVGKLADFAALDADLFSVPDEEIENVHVTTTVIGGKTVYSA